MPPEIAAQLPANLVNRPTGVYAPGGYNEIEILLTENSVRPKFNGGSLGGGGAQRNIPEAAADGYGQIALYVGGTGEVRFKDFMYRDILNHTWGPEEVGKNFRAVRVDPHYYSWSAAVADFNHDGILDIAAGPFYYLGPDYKVAKQIYAPVSFNPTSEWPIPAMVNLAYDFWRRVGRRAPDERKRRQRHRHALCQPEERVAPLGELCGAPARRQRRNIVEGH